MFKKKGSKKGRGEESSSSEESSISDEEAGDEEASMEECNNQDEESSNMEDSNGEEGFYLSMDVDDSLVPDLTGKFSKLLKKVRTIVTYFRDIFN